MKPRRRRPYKVKILYKSGNSITFRCKEFSISRGKASWSDTKPRIIWFGFDEVEAVYEL